MTAGAGERAALADRLVRLAEQQETLNQLLAGQNALLREMARAVRDGDEGTQAALSDQVAANYALILAARDRLEALKGGAWPRLLAGVVAAVVGSAVQVAAALGPLAPALGAGDD
ncbi:MAG: hypothetical protein IM628_12785 [Phenylobacterium sp.]|uniref:hypothetical protein n=1 Tax=Phenylobacterium sp. TaxID=1871053 RepID=UPI0025DC3E9F|nr:hypothetical protein [Phenylobacterium sp.]MCA6305674.1 hypothetical protein [Phenylobacterium sp.]